MSLSPSPSPLSKPHTSELAGGMSAGTQPAFYCCICCYGSVGLHVNQEVPGSSPAVGTFSLPSLWLCAKVGQRNVTVQILLTQFHQTHKEGTGSDKARPTQDCLATTPY